jgi:hypothetical protein
LSGFDSVLRLMDVTLPNGALLMKQPSLIVLMLNLTSGHKLL